MQKTKTNDSSLPIIDWYHCYDKKWDTEITSESVAHPAKFSRLLIKRIYELAIEEGWLEPGDTVLDVFGGIALGAIDALFNGINWLGIELEHNFIDMANGVECTGVSKEDYRRFYDRWDKFNRKDGRHWCPRCLAELKAAPKNNHEFPRSQKSEKRWQRMRELAKKHGVRLPQIKPMSLPGTVWGDLIGFQSKFQVMLFDDVADATYERNSGKIPFTKPHYYQGNLDLFRPYSRNGAQAMLVQGDSREMLRIIRSVKPDLALASPPYGQANSGGTAIWDRLEETHGREFTERSGRGTGYQARKQGDSNGQMGGMSEGDFDGAIGSPVYGSTINQHPSANDSQRRKERMEEVGIDTSYTPNVGGPNSVFNTKQNYGKTKGQLASMSEGKFDAAIGSPMFSGNTGGTGEASQQAINKALFKRHSGSMNKGLMSDDEANLGNMKHGDVDATIGSPPFEDSVGSDNAEKRGGILVSDPKRRNDKNLTGDYGQSDGQLGLEKGDTFWNASRTILEQCFLTIKPGGVSLWVLKDYVRNGEIVEFSDQWRRLCEAVGFETEMIIRAWLVEREAVQLDIEGEIYENIKSYKSFFRRVHEKNGLPAIDWEIVLVMRKPDVV